MGTAENLINYAADIWVALKGIAAELDAWNARPVRGIIYINGVPSMSSSETPTPIPSDDIPAKVEWKDRLGSSIDHSKTDTTWSAEDENGAASTSVTVNPDLDSDSDDETATVTFLQSQGQFRVVATTPGEGGVAVRAESVLYDIQPGAPAVGVITLG